MYGLINGMGAYINAILNLISLCNNCHDHIHRFDDNYSHTEKLLAYRDGQFLHDTHNDKKMLEIAKNNSKNGRSPLSRQANAYA
jgi:hypothetical protein